MDEEEEPPSPPRPERARAKPIPKPALPPEYKPSILQAARDRDEALADMTAGEALRVAAEEGIELETSDRLSVTGYVGVFLNHPGNRRQFQLQMSGSGSARQCVGSFSSAEAAALCKARIELEPDGLTHVIVRKVLGKLVETTARAVEHEQAEEHWREAAAAAKEERRQARERQTAAREAREAEAAAAEAKKAEAIVTRCLHREIRLLAEELSLSDHTLQLALERSDVLVEVHALHTKITRGAMLQGKRPWCFRYNGFSACVTSLVIVLPSGSTPWAGTASAQICSGVSAAELTRASLPRAAA